MRLNASRFVVRASACHQFTDSGPPRRGPIVFDLQPDDLSAAGSCATALARRHRTDSLGRVEVTGRDDMPPGLHNPRAEVRRTEAVPAPPAAGDGTRPPDRGTRSATQSRAINPVTSVVIPAMMANVEEVEVVVAHSERAEDPVQRISVGPALAREILAAPRTCQERLRDAQLGGESERARHQRTP